MQVIKKIFLIIYIVFLGFIVFCNTSVFGADGYILDRQIGASTNSFDEYFQDNQEIFDYTLLSNTRDNAFSYFNYWYWKNADMVQNWHYYVEPVAFSDLSATNGYNRGWRIYIYSQNQVYLTQSRTFSYADFQNYYMNNIGGVEVEDRSLYYTALQCSAWWVIDIYNSNNSIRFSNSNGATGGSSSTFYIPISLLNYPHNVIYDFNLSNTSGGQIASAINNQTNTIKEESQKQQNAVAIATQKQTNELLDTNNTGNETMSVNDTTTDTSADLSSFYTSINSAFTDNTIQTIKEFTFTLPNGDNFTIQLSASTILNFLNSFPVLKAFYQSIFWVIFGGYVIFDFKKIINKMKEGNIDNVVGTSSPVDSVVNMSLK